MKCDAIEDLITRGRIESLRVCYPTLDDNPEYRLNPVTPWGRKHRLQFQFGSRGINSVIFPWPLSSFPGKADTGVYFTTLAIEVGMASRCIDLLEQELRCLLGERVTSDWWLAPKQTHHRHLLRIVVDQDTLIEKCAFLGGKVTKEDTSSITKRCHAKVDVELVGVNRFDSEEDGWPMWRPRLRAVRVHIFEGVGLYTRSGIPFHNSQIREESNVSHLEYHGLNSSRCS